MFSHTLLKLTGHLMCRKLLKWWYRHTTIRFIETSLSWLHHPLQFVNFLINTIPNFSAYMSPIHDLSSLKLKIISRNLHNYFLNYILNCHLQHRPTAIRIFQFSIKVSLSRLQQPVSVRPLPYQHDSEDEVFSNSLLAHISPVYD